MEYGSLYLIPNYLGKDSLHEFNNNTKSIINEISCFVFENEKPGRAFLKAVSPTKNQSTLIVNTLNKFTVKREIKSFLEPCLNGNNIGLISDAGCPGIADPGADLISIAHEMKVKVKPLVGPSSIFLALMASGMNGQNFMFNGYLSIDKKERKEQIKLLEKKSNSTTQIFMETPYRNDNLIIDLISYLKPLTKLCIATDITLENELIKTELIRDWKKNKIIYKKRPSIFLIQSD
jgi:16S rRNA (cytidine1402-2'-O)-methyltransferase